jgi:hypothetical protein
LNTKVSTEEWKLEENRHKALKGMMGLYKLGNMVFYHVVEMGDLVVLSLKARNFCCAYSLAGACEPLNLGGHII